LERFNCGLIGCSIDSHFTHMEWTKKPRSQGGLGELSFPLLSDLSKKVSKDFGVLDEEASIALRGTFIVDDKGILRHITINDFPIGRNVDETLRVIQACQFSDKHGEVCPSSWKPGAPTLHGDPFSKKTQEYWEKVHSKKGGSH